MSDDVQSCGQDKDQQNGGDPMPLPTPEPQDSTVTTTIESKTTTTTTVEYGSGDGGDGGGEEPVEPNLVAIADETDATGRTVKINWDGFPEGPLTIDWGGNAGGDTGGDTGDTDGGDTEGGETGDTGDGGSGDDMPAPAPAPAATTEPDEAQGPSGEATHTYDESVTDSEVTITVSSMDKPDVMATAPFTLGDETGS